MTAADARTRYCNKALPELRYDFASEFGCNRGHDAPFNDKCQIRYDSSAEKMLGIEAPLPKADHEKTPASWRSTRRCLLFAPNAIAGSLSIAGRSNGNSERDGRWAKSQASYGASVGTRAPA